jgi:NADPH-dependent curcumin reductase CurA
MIIAMRIKMQGFIVFDYASQYPTARKEISQWLAEGKLQRKETIIKGGLPVAEQALVDLYQGVNTGMRSPLFHASSKKTLLLDLANK